MTNREKVLYLKRYSSVMKKVDRKLAAIDRLRSIQGKVTRSYEPRVSGGSIFRNHEEDIIVQIVDLRDEVMEDMGLAVDLCKETFGIIKTVDDHRLQFLLELRYISGVTWVQVADALELCQHTIYGLHNKALDRVVIPS